MYIHSQGVYTCGWLSKSRLTGGTLLRASSPSICSRGIQPSSLIRSNQWAITSWGEKRETSHLNIHYQGAMMLPWQWICPSVPLVADGIPHPRGSHEGRRSGREQLCRVGQASSPAWEEKIQHSTDCYDEQLLAMNIIILPVVQFHLPRWP